MGDEEGEGEEEEEEEGEGEGEEGEGEEEEGEGSEDSDGSDDEEEEGPGGVDPAFAEDVRRALGAAAATGSDDEVGVSTCVGVSYLCYAPPPAE